MWKENIIENHPKLNEEERSVWYNSFAEFCIYINDKYNNNIEIVN